MRRLGLFGSILVAIGAFFVSGVPVFGDTGTVNVTVTAQAQSCILLDTTSINYGTLAFGGSADRSVQFDTCTPSAQTFMARGSNAGGTNWTITDTGTCPSMGINQFKHNLQRLDTGSLFLTTADQTIGSLAGNTNDTLLNTTFIMPCAGSSGAGVTATTTIVLTSALAP